MAFDIRTGQGFDVHAFTDEKDATRLCGVDIPFHLGLKGHSDADVALHALCDALLGTIGAGDIGDFFPPSEEKWKGVVTRSVAATVPSYRRLFQYVALKPGLLSARHS